MMIVNRLHGWHERTWSSRCLTSNSNLSKSFSAGLYVSSGFSRALIAVYFTCHTLLPHSSLRVWFVCMWRCVAVMWMLVSSDAARHHKWIDFASDVFYFLVSRNLGLVVDRQSRGLTITGHNTYTYTQKHTHTNVFKAIFSENFDFFV